MKSAPEEQSTSTVSRSGVAWLVRSFAARALALVDFPLSALPIFASTIVLSLLSILMTTPLAYLSWRFVEIPAINFAKKCWPRLVRPAPAPG